MIADEADVAALAEVLLLGPDFDAGDPLAGEWGQTVARGLARRAITAGWRPPIDTPPALPTPPPGRAGGGSAIGAPMAAETGCICGQTAAGCAETGRQAARHDH